MRSLAVFPLISMTVHLYVAGQLEDNTLYLTEGYLGVFWIFIISGMTFRYAFASASIVSIGLIGFGYYFISKPDAFVLHAFWIFCSYSFGFMGALVGDRSRMVIFLNQQVLQKFALTDTLTGIHNRAMLNQVLAQEMARDLRYNKSFGFLIIDIDNFKLINDAHGHDVGDEVIRRVARVLSETMRKNDTLVRWGGEEFVVLALELDNVSLGAICDKLRMTIELAEYPIIEKLTVSIGATLFCANDTQDSLLARADKALYNAKSSVRNQSVVQI